MTMRWVDNGPIYPMLTSKGGRLCKIVCELEIEGDEFNSLGAIVTESPIGYLIHRHGHDALHASTLDEARAMAVALVTLGG